MSAKTMSRAEAQVRAAMSSLAAEPPPLPLPGASREGSRNGLTHGLYSQEAVIRGEDPADFEAYRADLLAEMRPAGTRECDLVETMAMSQWKLRRLWRGETQACAKLCDSQYGRGESQAHAILNTFHGARRYAALTGHEAHLMRAYLRAESRLRLLQELREKGLAKEREAAAREYRQPESHACPEPAPNSAPEPVSRPLAPVKTPPAEVPMDSSHRQSGEILNRGVPAEPPHPRGMGAAGSACRWRRIERL